MGGVYLRIMACATKNKKRHEVTYLSLDTSGPVAELIIENWKIVKGLIGNSLTGRKII
jgi:hypothetical protein